MRPALFDLDGTVLRGNSWHEYFWWSLRRWPTRAPGLLIRLALRRGGFITAEDLREAALHPLRGLNVAAIAEIGRGICAERLVSRVRPVARREIARARAEGCEPVLATGAFDFLAMPLAEALGIREVVCSRLEFRDGRCLGKILGAETRGAEKAEAVRRHFAGREIDWTRGRAFSDDLEDIPLWSLVGEGTWVTSTQTRPAALPEHVRVVSWDS